MRKENKILLFLDLEGTILRESDGKYDKEKMYKFLEEIDKLQELTDTNVNLHLVSPVFQKQMEEIMDQIDNDIIKYNSAHPQSNNIPEIECGAFTEDRRMYEEEFRGDRIMPLKMPIDSRQFDTSRYGKAQYVRKWIEMYRERGQLITSIYCGNGRNDLSAMDYVKGTKGFVVCPNNSRTQAKQIADFVSDKTDLPGITDGIKGINGEIEKRVELKKDAKENGESR